MSEQADLALTVACLIFAAALMLIGLGTVLSWLV